MGLSNLIRRLQRSHNLAPAGFQTIATNLSGQPEMTSYVDTNAASQGPLFYCVCVSAPTLLRPVSQREFEGSTSDTSGSGNDGTVTGAPAC